jgi:hypothetical protein
MYLVSSTTVKLIDDVCNGNDPSSDYSENGAENWWYSWEQQDTTFRK